MVSFVANHRSCLVSSADGIVQVVHALHHAGARELVHGHGLGLAAVRGRVRELDLAGTGNAHLHVAVHVSVRVTRDGDGCLPRAHVRLDALYQDGRAEHGAVQHGADGAVGALPHLLEVVFLHARGVGRDGGALDGHAQALGGVGGVDRHLVVRGVAVLEPQVEVLGLQVDERDDEVVLDHLPHDALLAIETSERASGRPGPAAAGANQR